MRGYGPGRGGAGHHDPTDSRWATTPATRPSGPCSWPDLDPAASHTAAGLDRSAARPRRTIGDRPATGHRSAAKHTTDITGYQRSNRTRPGVDDNRPPDPSRPGRHRRPALGGTPHGTTTTDIGPPDQPTLPDHVSDDDGSSPDDGAAGDSSAAEQGHRPPRRRRPHHLQVHPEQESDPAALPADILTGRVASRGRLDAVAGSPRRCLPAMPTHDHDHEQGLKPEPLGDEVVLDDPTEDRARANTTVGEVVEEDLDSPHTASRRLPDGGAAGFDVPTEPLELDLPDDVEVARPWRGRDTDDLPPL